MEYDLAFSFAGEHREYVEATKDACVALGLRVFYDRDKSNAWWGRNFLTEQRKVYGSQTRYFVPFVSAEYFDKPYTRDEFETAMVAAVEKFDEYILPVMIGEVNVPPARLNPHIGFLRANDYSPEELASEFNHRLGATSRHTTRDIAEVVQGSLDLPMPKVVPPTFSKYQELQRVFDYLSDSFQSVLPRLAEYGFIGSAEKLEQRLIVRVERDGATVYSLDINKGSSFGDDRLEFSVDQHRMTSGGINGWATPFYDTESKSAKVKMFDLSVFASSGGEQVLEKEELFPKLWQRLLDRLEGRS